MAIKILPIPFPDPAHKWSDVWNIVAEVVKYARTGGVELDIPCEKCLPKVEAELYLEFASAICRLKEGGHNMVFQSLDTAYKFMAREVTSGYRDGLKAMSSAAAAQGCCGDFFAKLHVGIVGDRELPF